MWNTNTLWFDVAVVMSIFAVGSVLFGRTPGVAAATRHQRLDGGAAG